MRVIITAPSLDTSHNVSGVSAVTRFIVSHNSSCQYVHFALGKRDCEARNLRWLGRTLRSYARWIQTLLGEGRALIHFNLALDRRSLLRDSPLIMIARLLRRRVIIHIHGGELIAGKGISALMKSLIEVTLGRGPIIVLSELEQGLLEGRVRKGATLITLPNCVGVEQAETFERADAGDGVLRILFLGRISVNKGIDVLYEALVAARKKDIAFSFVMAGTGPEETAYVRKFRELLGDRFEFTGVVGGPEKTEVLKQCNVFLLPSLFEGMPMALLESMAFGLVPIVTDVGSIRAVVSDEENGVIVNTRAPLEIVEALSRLSADRPYAQRLGANARQRILQRCRPDDYVKQLNAIYCHE